MLPIKDSKMSIIAYISVRDPDPGIPVAVRRLGQGWARNAPTATHTLNRPNVELEIASNVNFALAAAEHRAALAEIATVTVTDSCGCLYM